MVYIDKYRQNGDSGRTRTPNLLIRSQFNPCIMLYQLVYNELHICSKYNWLLCEAVKLCKIESILSKPVL